MPAARPHLLLAGWVALLIVVQLALRQDEAGWNAKAHPYGVVTLDGHLVEWEWFHVDEAIVLVDGDGHRTDTARDQNVFRFLPAYLTALLREPLGSYYGGAVVGEGVIWMAAAAAAYALARRAARSETAGLTAAVLTATGPGFVGYVGQVDAHPAAYAGVAVVPALLARLSLGEPGVGVPRRALRAASGGIAICIAGYTIETAYPLLLFVALFYGGEALLYALRARRFAELGSTMLELLFLAGAFALPYAGFRALVGVLFDEVLRFNDPLSYLTRHPDAVRSLGLAAWLEGLARSLADIWLFTFPAPVTVLALVGVVALALGERRWLRWAMAYGAAFGAAVLLTKPTPRELFLLHPAVYVLAGAGVSAVARLATASTHRWLATRSRRIVQDIVVAVSLSLAIAATNADVWGDYAIPFAWYTLG